ncbi:MAG: methyltransferase domain-containing protein [Burkholderiaceae bacterium]|nr:methyltransferase domain-containing protein [Burkholderiaceae bacterium]
MNSQTLATAQQRAAARQLVELIGGNWATQAIGVAARLGLADQVAAGVTRVDPLARACGCDAAALHRLLRGLAALGLVRLEADGDGDGDRDSDRCSLTPTGELLRRDAALSLHSHAQWWSSQAWGVWSDLMGSVQTGQSTRQRAHGQRGFDHLAVDAGSARLFHRSMVELTRLVAADLAISPALPDSGLVMDLGGGHGELLVEVLRARPGLRGLLFDLDHAAAGGQARLREAGLADRATVTSGDFFAELPQPVDVILLKSVLHDWNDDDAVRILRRACQALAPEGRVLVIERVMPDRVQDLPEHRTAARSDLNMLVGLGGRERTAADYGALLHAAGLAPRRTLSCSAAFSVIEAGRSPPRPGPARP